MTKSRKAPKASLNQEQAPLRAFSDAVGNFMRYWGFRRIHGQIWTQAYLSKIPLSGADLTRRLGVSKALVSPAISELLEYELLLPAGGDSKKKLFIAHPDVFSVIRKVLRERERLIFKDAAARFRELEKCAKLTPTSEIDPERLVLVGQMISSAEAGLAFVLQTASEEDFSQWGELNN
jgi:DNA-binding transcriptional regulator GbsR (MarR family)